MVPKISLFLFLIQSNLVFNVWAAPSEKCSQTEADFDECASRMSVFDRDDAIIPTNDAELDEFCKLALDSLKCARSYARRCMSEFPKTVYGIYQYDVKREIKKRCQSKEGREEYMKHMKCGKEKGLAQQRKCIHNFDAQLEWIFMNIPKEQQVLVTCCAIHYVHRCIVNETSKLCDSVTGPTTAGYFDKTIGASISEGVDYSCGKYKSYDDCATHLDPKIWQNMVAIGEDPAKINFKPKNKSPITTIVKIYSQFS
ncbi:uncharacterized protein LOC141856749 [Brevipalpus obovatus]|uniref:uncharacterized protein LOC141856749 n=1 Tax=Brevipalpus obovatus TaxID=246614 RepID=UPI003D9F5901